jgi:hypothetical protein
MSTKYPGGIITKNYVAPTPSSASGIWTLDQQEQAQKAGIWPFGGPFTYIEDVFSCFLYTGNGTTQTITNGIDLSTKGGLVWGKDRKRAADHSLYDTARGVSNYITTDSAGANVAEPAGRGVTGFNTTGFSLGTDSSGSTNDTNQSYVSWTFREQPKFFDIVTWTGTGVARTIAHNLGSVPGCIIVKCIDGPASTQPWAVYHRSTGNTQALFLNLTQVPDVATNYWNDTTPTSTVFSLGASASVNNNTSTYIAYLFAHDAGGFGLTGTDNVISCGSFNYNTFPQTVTLGYEPQWLMVKQTDGVGDWIMFDNMRGFTANSGGGAGKRLLANTSGAETANDGLYYGSATGFNLNLPAYGNYIYIAIRRGPMAVPTTGTSVFTPAIRTGTSATANITSAGFPVDLALIGRRNTDGLVTAWDRLRGAPLRLITSNGNAESSSANGLTGFDSMTGFTLGNNNTINDSTYNYVDWDFRRAPSFFDVVCYTGTGSARTVTHNLAAVPELMIIKQRSGVNGWPVYSSGTGNTKFAYLNQALAFDTNSSAWNNTSPTSSVFTVGSGSLMNTNAATYVAYLFATCAGVSKVGSYTGTGATQTVACGFGAGGARFVLIKRADDTGDWYVWDTARGMVSGTDPSLLLNDTAAEVNANSVYTIATGFQIVSTAAGINASGGTYIFLAIA